MTSVVKLAGGSRSNSTLSMSILSAVALELRRVPLQEIQQQLANPSLLLLLPPVPGAFEQVAAGEASARRVLHALDRPRSLIDAPVTRARDEDRRDVDGPPGEQLQLGLEGAATA